MAERLRERLRRGILVGDGAWGTLLQEHGLPAGHPPDEWNLSHPDNVAAVAEAYVEAGSDLILTNTFGANPWVLQRNGDLDRLTEINREGVLISRRAAGDRVLVVASIGPSGEFLEPLGSTAPLEMQVGFRRQVESLLEGGPDGFVIETMSDPQEALCALRAVRETTDLPVVVSMTFDSGEDGMRTMMGRSPEDVVRSFADIPIDAVGANCGRGPDAYVQLAEQFRSATDLPLWIKANAGMPRLGKDGRQIFPLGPDAYAAFVPRIVAAGARVVGGCCGTTPQHIRAIRGVVDRLCRRA